jgi:hypothetical protein
VLPDGFDKETVGESSPAAPVAAAAAVVVELNMKPMLQEQGAPFAAA